MDIVFNDILHWIGVTAPVVGGYVGYVHKRQNDTDKALGRHKLYAADTFIKKEDYREDLTDLKDMISEMQRDIKDILKAQR